MKLGAIFDMDGTLLDSMPVWEHASERYLENQEIKVREKLSEVLFSMSMREGAVYVKEKYGLPEDIETIVAGVNAIVFAAYEREVQPKAGVRELLEEMKCAGIPMAVATSTDRPMVEAALKRTSLMPYFGRIFTCSEVGAGKSKPDIYTAAAEYLNRKPGQIWVFEDALYAAETAKAAGFRTVGIYDAASGSEQEQLRAVADVYLEKFVGLHELAAQMGAADM